MPAAPQRGFPYSGACAATAMRCLDRVVGPRRAANPWHIRGVFAERRRFCDEPRNAGRRYVTARTDFSFKHTVPGA